ncbi:alpha/beta hydrolase [Candidatus Formimonas warabiya]|uniref:AB hydrolase-1 domain-containing protein n=1 Tax=Formimonas warabiya TaxID=1761012 RepID=A0A3G1KRL6_FORW1|nr:alpha/beta hydrolase [Candidatus Formimonas warabiya]ATW25080.1 hypothetical protein DCMF_10090 [Candidatus Formimonas warabiya]
MVLGKKETREEQVSIPCQHQNMAGILHIPGIQDIPAWIVMLHGFADDKVEKHRMFVKLGRRLAAQGFGALRFDFLGCGDSEGDLEDATIAGYIEQALQALDWLRKRPQTGKDTKIGLLGYSLGGAVAACAAPLDGGIDTLALWAPASNLYRNVANYVGEENLRRGLAGAWVDSPDGDRVGPHFFQGLRDVDPVAEIKKYPQETLLIQGTQDQVIFPVDAMRYQQAFRHPESRVHYIQGAGHRFDTYLHEQELLDETVCWFAAKLI